MIAVFWKEVRENLRWASLAFVAMAATLIRMWQGSQLVLSDGDRHMFACMITVFTGIALGILQTRRDKRPASRALLFHRGITADAAFAGKLLAGLALYFFAVYVPLLAMAVFIAFNGIEHKAASPTSMVPLALWALVAFGFWPATLLSVQRDARAWGSRLTPVVSAFAIASFSLAPWDATGSWLISSLILVLGLSFLFLAARSVFTNSGYIATGIGRAALALTVSVAFLFMFLIIATTIDSSRSTAARQYTVQIGPDGRPWLGCEDYSQQDRRYRLALTAEMEVGGSVRDRLQPIAEDWKTTPYWTVDRFAGNDGRRPWTRFTRLSSTASSRPSGYLRREWVFDRKSDTILVYHLTPANEWQLARRLAAPSPARSFGQIRWHSPSDANGSITLVTSTGAFYVPGDGSAVTMMYQAPKSSAITVSKQHLAGGIEHPYATMLRLAERVVLLESTPDKAAVSRAKPIGEVNGRANLYATEILLPHELADFKSLNIARDPVNDGAYLGLAQSGKPSERRFLWARFDADGDIAAKQEYIENTESDLAQGESMSFVFTTPGVWATFMIGLVASDDYSTAKAWEKACEYVREDPAEAVREILLFLLPAIVGVILSIWAARRRQVDKGQTWLAVALGFLMGPAGSLSVLAVYPRIVRERCISCQKPTRIDLDWCEHCGHSANDVPRIGIEIFDRDTVASPTPPETIGSC